MQAFHGRFDDGLLPEDLSVGAIEAEEEALLRLRHGSHSEKLFTPGDHRGVSTARDLRSPCYAVGFAPVGGEGGFHAAAIESRAAPLRPVLGTRYGGKNKQ